MVRPNVTWTSAIRVFLTHLNTEQVNERQETDQMTSVRIHDINYLLRRELITYISFTVIKETTHFLWVQRSLLWAWSKVRPGRLSSRLPRHHNLTGRCRHQPPPTNSHYTLFRLGCKTVRKPAYVVIYSLSLCYYIIISSVVWNDLLMTIILFERQYIYRPKFAVALLVVLVLKYLSVGEEVSR